MHPVPALVRDSPSCLLAQPHISLKKILKYLDIRVLVHFAFAPSPSIHCASSREDILLRAGCSSTLYLFKCIIDHISLPTSISWVALLLLVRRRLAVLPCWHFLLSSPFFVTSVTVVTTVVPVTPVILFTRLSCSCCHILPLFSKLSDWYANFMLLANPYRGSNSGNNNHIATHRSSMDNRHCQTSEVTYLCVVAQPGPTLTHLHL